MTQRHAPGRGSQLTADERREIQEMALIEGLSQSEIARRTGRDRGTVSNVLKGDDTAALKQQLTSAGAEEARNTLRRSAARMAGNWVNAADVAAGKGDHRPSRDLLLHTGVIQPVVADQGPRIAVQINLHGGPEPVSLLQLNGTAAADSAPMNSRSIIGLNPAAHASEGGGGPRPKERTHTPSLPRPIATQNFSSEKGLPSATDPGRGIGSNAPGACDE